MDLHSDVLLRCDVVATAVRRSLLTQQLRWQVLHKQLSVLHAKSVLVITKFINNSTIVVHALRMPKIVKHIDNPKPF